MDTDEIWVRLMDYPLYEVSSVGNLRKFTTRRALKGSPDKDGYVTVSLYRDGTPFGRRVHRLVCEAFHGPAPEGKPWALHRNGNHTDNRAENLYWGSPAENSADALRHGTHSGLKDRGERCVRGHLFTERDVNPSTGYRQCHTCVRERTAQIRSQGIRPDDPRHGTLNGYNNCGCRCYLCGGAAKLAYRKARDARPKSA